MVDVEMMQNLIYFLIRMRVDVVGFRGILFVVLILAVQVIGGFNEMVDADLKK